MNPIDFLTNIFRKFFRKLKRIMANKKVQKILIIGSVAATAFFAGKYYEKYHPWRRVDLQVYPALPLVGSVSIKDDLDSDEPTANFTKTSFKLSLNKFHDLSKKFGQYFDFGKVKAAAPFKEPDMSILTPAPNVEPSKPKPRMSEIMKYGFPGLDNIRSFDDYVLSYDRKTRVAHWVFEHLTPESVRRNNEIDRSKCTFKPDDSIHPFFRSHNTDFKKSGYDRGHLAAAGNHKDDQKHIEETFYLTNIAPQVGKGFNRDSWNRLEKYVRKLTKTYPHVYCCTGPLYLPKREADGKVYVKYEVIGANHVAVPTHFYKIVVGERKDGTLEMESYVMANEVIDDRIPLANFVVPPETIEKAAGLLFFNNVTRKNLKKINGRNN